MIGRATALPRDALAVTPGVGYNSVTRFTPVFYVVVSECVLISFAREFAMKHRNCLLLLLFSYVAVAVAFVPAPVVADKTAVESDEAIKKAEKDEEFYELFRLFADTLDQVERNYVKDISRRELMEAAIQGVISKLDQHSNYIAPDDLDGFRTDVESEFGGIGIHVSKPSRDAWLRVLSPIAGSPAYRAGILAGDVISHIGDSATNELEMKEAVSRIKGKLGTEVRITVRHLDGTSEEIDVERQIVRVETVLGDRRTADASWDFMLDDEKKIAYVRVTAFARHTTAALRKVLVKLKSQEMHGLILDLRSNPGGLLSAAIQISDMFVEEGRIVSTSGRNVEDKKWDAHQRGTFSDFPMVVLVNNYSASASEIVAACLQDHDRAIVVGQRTYGKGSVQNIIELEQGRSALKLTTAQYLRPNGKNIHRFKGATEDDEWGVSPSPGWDVEQSRAETVELAESRRARDVIRAGTDSKEPDAVADKVLDKARSHLTKLLEDKPAAVAGDANEKDEDSDAETPQ
ncbi:MAG: peptidase S41 [Planctomycetaceae bacterium]|nr:peptidase S41 [Planctomycetaceae bacterium]